MFSLFFSSRISFMHFVWLLFSLVPFNLDQFPGLLYCFPSQGLFRVQASCFTECPPFWLEYQIGDVLYFILCCIRRHIMSAFPILVKLSVLTCCCCLTPYCAPVTSHYMWIPSATSHGLLTEVHITWPAIPSLPQMNPTYFFSLMEHYPDTCSMSLPN